MATRKAKTEGERKGETNGEGNGESPGKTLEFDAFIDEVTKRAGDFHRDVHVSASVGERRTVGSRLGKLPLQPLETLDDRIDAEWPGPRVVILRTKWAATGGWAITGYYDVPPPKATSLVPAAGTSDAALTALLKQIETQNAELKELRTMIMTNATAKKDDGVDKEMGALERIATVFRSMQPPAPPAPPAPPTLREQLNDLKDASAIFKDIGGGAVSVGAGLGEVIVENCKDGINDVLRATAGLLATKAGFVPKE